MTSAAKVGIVMLIALAVLGYFVIKIEDIDLRKTTGTREVKAVFDDVAGLEDESTVRIGGVAKGHVTGIKALPDGRAEVTMEIEDDIALHGDAFATVANLGLLGERYVEIEPGTPGAPVIATGTTPTLPGSQPATIDEVTTQISEIADDMKAITSSLRQVMTGPEGQKRLEDIVENVSAITREVRALVAANRANVDATMANTRVITEQLRREIPRLADSLDRVAAQVGDTVGENREDVRHVVENIRGLSADLRVTADNLNAITGQMKSGEGTMGKLLYSEEAHQRLSSALASVESGVTELKTTLSRASRMRLELGIRSDFLAGMSDTGEIGGVTPDFGGTSRSTLGLRLLPNPDHNRFYNVELSDDPRGKRRDKLSVDTRTNPDTGQSETVVTRSTRFDRDFLVSAQAGWTLDPLAVRIGLFDSTGGIGADYRLGDRVTVTGEAFDFGEKRDDNPHIRLFGQYAIRKEKPHTPRLFLTTGVDNALNDTTFMFGGGVRWTDDDLKYLLGSIPVGR